MTVHNDIINLFKQKKEAGTLSHAYILIGPTHVGKRRLANTIAADLVDTSVEKVAVHPDVRIVGRERNEKTGKLRKDISVDQIRNIRTYAASGPVMSAHSVIILEQAELMNASAANSLLKTLEEPHEKTVIILTVTDPSRVPPTILSRSQAIYVHPLGNEALAEAIPGISSDILEAAQGLPEVAYKLHTDAEALEQYQSQQQTFDTLFGRPLHEKREQIAYLFAKKEDHIAGRQQILEHARMWKLFIRQMLTAGDDRLTALQGVKMYDTLEELELQIRQNVHPRAAVDAFLLTIP